MTDGFADIGVAGIDEERTSRAGPSGVVYDVYFALTAVPPDGWQSVAQSRLSTAGVAGHPAWPQRQAVVVRCRVDDVERVAAALRPLLVTVNREYRVRADAHARDLADAEASDRRERAKLRALTGRLTFH